MRNEDVDLTDEGLLFPEAESQLVPARFLRTQRQKYEEARLKAIVSNAPSEKKTRKVTKTMKRERMRKKLRRAARKTALKEFMREVKIRKGEGYSAAQLLASHIPDIGVEVRVSEAEVSAALKRAEASYICIRIGISVDV